MYWSKDAGYLVKIVFISCFVVLISIPFNFTDVKNTISIFLVLTILFSFLMVRIFLKNKKRLELHGYYETKSLWSTYRERGKTAGLINIVSHLGWALNSLLMGISLFATVHYNWPPPYYYHLLIPIALFALPLIELVLNFLDRN